MTEGRAESPVLSGAARTLVSRTDWVVIVATAAAVTLSYPLLWSGSEGSGDATAAVIVNGEEHTRLPLREAAELTVEGALGPTVIRVEEGAARVVEDPGPQQLCVRVGEIRRPGQAAVCLPNRVVVEIRGDQSAYDAFNY